MIVKMVMINSDWHIASFDLLLTNNRTSTIGWHHCFLGQ